MTDSLLPIISTSQSDLPLKKTGESSQTDLTDKLSEAESRRFASQKFSSGIENSKEIKSNTPIVSCVEESETSLVVSKENKGNSEKNNHELNQTHNSSEKNTSSNCALIADDSLSGSDQSNRNISFDVENVNGANQKSVVDNGKTNCSNSSAINTNILEKKLTELNQSNIISSKEEKGCIENCLNTKMLTEDKVPTKPIVDEPLSICDKPTAIESECNINMQTSEQEENENPLTSDNTKKENENPITSDNTKKENENPITSDNTKKENESPLTSDNPKKENENPLTSHNTKKENENPLTSDNTKKENENLHTSDNTKNENENPHTSDNTKKENENPLTSDNTKKENENLLTSHNTKKIEGYKAFEQSCCKIDNSPEGILTSDFHSLSDDNLDDLECKLLKKSLDNKAMEETATILNSKMGGRYFDNFENKTDEKVSLKAQPITTIPDTEQVFIMTSNSIRDSNQTSFHQNSISGMAISASEVNEDGNEIITKHSNNEPEAKNDAENTDLLAVNIEQNTNKNKLETNDGSTNFVLLSDDKSEKVCQYTIRSNIPTKVQQRKKVNEAENSEQIYLASNVSAIKDSEEQVASLSGFKIKQCIVDLGSSRINDAILSNDEKPFNPVTKPNFEKLKRKLEEMINSAQKEEEKAMKQLKKMKLEKSSLLKDIVKELEILKRKFGVWPE